MSQSRHLHTFFGYYFQSALSLASYNVTVSSSNSVTQSGMLNLNKLLPPWRRLLRASPSPDICHSASRGFLDRENLSKGKGIKAYCFSSVTDLSGSVINLVINSVIPIHQHGMKWFNHYRYWPKIYLMFSFFYYRKSFLKQIYLIFLSVSLIQVSNVKSRHVWLRSQYWSIGLYSCCLHLG